jgi:hypothetical protein
LDSSLVLFAALGVLAACCELISLLDHDIDLEVVVLGRSSGVDLSRGGPGQAGKESDPLKEIHEYSVELGVETGFGARENQPR